MRFMGGEQALIPSGYHILRTLSSFPKAGRTSPNTFSKSSILTMPSFSWLSSPSSVRVRVSANLPHSARDQRFRPLKKYLLRAARAFSPRSSTKSAATGFNPPACTHASCLYECAEYHVAPLEQEAPFAVAFPNAPVVKALDPVIRDGLSTPLPATIACLTPSILVKS